LKIYKQILGENHLYYATSLNNLALLYYNTGNYEKAITLMEKANENYINQINSYFTFLSENEKEKFLKTIEYNFEVFYSHCLQYYAEKPEISAELLNLRLATKGVILSSLNRIREAVEKSGNPELIALYEKSISSKRNLYNATLLSLEEQKKRGIDLAQLEKQANDLEKELARNSEPFKQLLEEQKISFQQIQNSLSAGEAAIEFLEFQYYYKKWTDTTYYIALVILPGNKTPIIVKLCTGKDLENQMSFSSDNIDKSRGVDPENKQQGKIFLSDKYRNIYNLIWKPLEQYIQNCNTVYISPSGILNKVSFAALTPDGSSFLMDKINIRYIGNLRDIVKEKKQKEQFTINTAVLFGGAYFDAGQEDIKNYIRTTDISKGKGTINPFAYKDSKDVLIGDSRSSDRGESWNYLSGTLKEVKEISIILQDRNITLVLDTGLYANEQNLKGLSGSKQAEILHIATHGFFLADTRKEKMRNIFNIEQTKQQAVRLLDNPLYRSGIVLSGANSSIYEKRKTDTTKEDGIITAYEISLIDLTNTELAVLSACETGLGDIKGGEGVYGLQRAFKVAGAKNVIISLWKVPDEETAELMNIFYDNWLTKRMNKRDALLDAQKQMRQKKPNPYYWAAFVMM